jgi:hypothetical protein
MKSLQVLKNVENKALFNKVNSIVDAIYNDYFSKISRNIFNTKYLDSESVVSKCIAYRFAEPEVLNNIFSKTLQKFKYNLKDYCLHPIFYVRKSFYNNNNKSNSILETQPHYDNSYSVFANTCWLALANVNKNTGGLCFFKNDKNIERLFKMPFKERNKYNFEKYYSDANKIDKIIKKKIIFNNLKKGGVCIFDSKKLHGGIRGKNSIRMSFDFRFYHKNQLIKTSAKNRKILNFFRENHAYSNAKHLFILGDKIGSEYYIKKYNLDKQMVESTAPRKNLKKDLKMHWSDEYAWLQ